jgi:hypothetical protein
VEHHDGSGTRRRDDVRNARLKEIETQFRHLRRSLRRAQGR